MRLVLTVPLVLAISACQQPDKRLDELEKKMPSIEADQALLKATVDLHDSRLDLVESLQVRNSRPTSGVFSPANREFQVIHTDIGVFMVSLVDVTPYANGYKVRFHLGNPSYVDYEGVELELKWGPARPADGFKTVSYADWQKRFKTGKQSITKRIRQGSWNPVEVTLIPATVEDIGHIEVTSISARSVFLMVR